MIDAILILVGCGCFAVGITTMIFASYSALIYELEDPTEGGWVRAQILKNHPSLLTVDSEEVFAQRWRRYNRKVRRKRTKGPRSG